MKQLGGTQGAEPAGLAGPGADSPPESWPATRPEGAIGLLCPGGYEHAGGIGRVMRQLTNVWETMPDGPMVTMIDTRGHGGPAVAFTRFIGALLTVARLRLMGNLALLHVNLASRGSTARKIVFSQLAVLLGIPTVVHLHGALFDLFYRGLPRPLQFIVRRIFVSSARVVVLGAAWRDFVVKEIGIPESKVQVVFNGTRQPKILSLPDPGRTPRILFLGRLGARKGVPELLQALAIPEMRARRWSATLAGDGEIERFKTEAATLGLAEKIAFPGWVGQDEAEAMLRSADILVLPSHQEGLPMSVIEGLAHRVAVIASPVGATPELIEDEASGLLVPPGDVEALAHAMCRLIDDSELRQRLAEAGYRVFREKLNIETSARQFAAIYAEIAAKPRQAA